jgi:hypothetical protein
MLELTIRTKISPGKVEIRSTLGTVRLEAPSTSLSCIAFTSIVTQTLERTREDAAGLKGAFAKQSFKSSLELVEPWQVAKIAPLKAGPNCVCNSDAKSRAALRILWFELSISYFVIKER